MHGTILHGFKEFVTQRHGNATWASLVQTAGAGGWYLSTQTYPDRELVALVQATAQHEGRPVTAVLEDFGAALVPVLLSLYQAFLDPAWRTLDLLANTETVIHRTVRLRDPKATPPELRVRRVSADELHIDYASTRRLCALAVGICRGVASRYGDTITIEQPDCMEAGAPACRIVVRRTVDDRRSD
jgi:hypothetical protein